MDFYIKRWSRNFLFRGAARGSKGRLLLNAPWPGCGDGVPAIINVPYLQGKEEACSSIKSSYLSKILYPPPVLPRFWIINGGGDNLWFSFVTRRVVPHSAGLIWRSPFRALQMAESFCQCNTSNRVVTRQCDSENVTISRCLSLPPYQRIKIHFVKRPLSTGNALSCQAMISMALEMDFYIKRWSRNFLFRGAALFAYFLLLLTESMPGCGVGDPAIINIPYFQEKEEVTGIKPNPEEHQEQMIKKTNTPRYIFDALHNAYSIYRIENTRWTSFCFIMLITTEEILSVNLRIEKCDNHIPFAEGKKIKHKKIKSKSKSRSKRNKISG